MKKPNRFTGLHAHDGFSIFDGMGMPQEHFDFVIENTKHENNIPSLAITNHGNMNSYAHAYLYAKQLNSQGQKFKFLPGCEIYMHPDLDLWKKQYDDARLAKEEAKKAGKKAAKEDKDADQVIENEEETKSSKFYDPIKRRHHLVVLAKHSKGLQHLFHTVSRGFLEGMYKFPRVDLKMLKQYKGSFIGSSSCIGGPLAFDVFSNFQDKEFDELKPHLVDDPYVMQKVLGQLENSLDQIVDAFGEENFFLELQFNSLNAQHLVNRCILELAKKTGLPLISTADSHYARPEYWKEREIYKKLGWLNFKTFDPEQLPKSKEDLKCELYPKNAEQMWDSYKSTTAQYDFYDDEVVLDSIERTYDIAHNLIDEVNPDTSVKLPKSVVPKGQTAAEELRKQCFAGLEDMGFGDNQEYIDRLNYELSVIIERDFCEYFLVMKSIIEIASKNMLVGCGRGSGAGSLINYVLGITQVDPIKYGLIFERFISKYRKEMPDIDSDIADRDLLIDLLKNEFGNTNVVPISNFNTFKLKSLVKDVSRFYGIPFEEVNRATRNVENEVKAAVQKPGDDKNLFQLKFEDCVNHSQSFGDFIEQYPQVAEPIEVLFKQNKAVGKHAGGVIVSENVAEKMPLLVSKKQPQTPWVEGMHYKTLEQLGWVKFDLLGLETLRIIQRCVKLILERHGNDEVELELDNNQTIKCNEFQKIKLTDGRWKMVKTLNEDDDILIPVELL